MIPPAHSFGITCDAQSQVQGSSACDGELNGYEYEDANLYTEYAMTDGLEFFEARSKVMNDMDIEI